MKVYAVTKDLKLEEHKSQKAFLAQCNEMGWCDQKYIRIATSSDLKERYSEPLSELSRNGDSVGVVIIGSKDDLAAHALLHNEFNKRYQQHEAA